MLNLDWFLGIVSGVAVGALLGTYIEYLILKWWGPRMAKSIWSNFKDTGILDLHKAVKQLKEEGFFDEIKDMISEAVNSKEKT